MIYMPCKLRPDRPQPSIYRYQIAPPRTPRWRVLLERCCIAGATMALVLALIALLHFIGPVWR